MTDKRVFRTTYSWIECAVYQYRLHDVAHMANHIYFRWYQLAQPGLPVLSFRHLRAHRKSANNKRSSSSRIRENSPSPQQFGGFVSRDRASCMCNDSCGVPRTALARPFIATLRIVPWFMHVKLKPSIQPQRLGNFASQY